MSYGAPHCTSCPFLFRLPGFGLGGIERYDV
jgi:hypothetical protein